MRPLTLLIAAAAALVCAAPASASLPDSGFVVFKESRHASVTEVRAAGTGQLVYSATSLSGGGTGADACADRSYAFTVPKWKTFEPYHVNITSTPSHIGRRATLGDLKAAHDAWEVPFVTDCTPPKGTAGYVTEYGGTTTSLASLATDLGTDGENTVAFQSLAGSVCDGATACVVLLYEKKTILEADMALEKDLTRYGFKDYWTTDDTTWWNETGGRWSVSDVGTHEFGHFAGLDHVPNSPALTMYPFVHDGAQTLGLGDMRGILARY
jgi:Matrixin